MRLTATRSPLLTQDHYVFLVDVFRYYSATNAGSGNEAAFSMSLNAFTDFCQRCDITDRNFCKLSDVDTIFIAANVTKSGEKPLPNNPERSLTRFEFMEAVVRLAVAKFGKAVRSVLVSPTCDNELSVKHSITQLKLFVLTKLCAYVFLQCFSASSCRDPMCSGRAGKAGEEVQNSECVHRLITRHVIPFGRRRHNGLFREERLLTRAVHELLVKETATLRR